MVLNENNWITELCEEGASAFSLKSRANVYTRQSAFQKVEVFDTVGYGKLMMIDGFTMLSSRDNFLYHEMMSHPVLFPANASWKASIKPEAAPCIQPPWK